MFIIFLTAEKFWNHSSLVCKVGVVDCVVEVSDAGIDDSSVERWLFLCWKPCRRFGWRIRVEREASFLFCRRVVVEKKKSNPCRSSFKPKVFFSCFFFQMAAKSSSLSHVSFLKSKMRTKSTRALSFLPFSRPAILQGRMTSWDWSLRRQHWKLFKWSFHGWRWSRRRCCISNLDSWVD